MSTKDKEHKKKNRELSVSILLAIAFCFLAWFEIRVFSFGKQLPLKDSIFFFGLVNFNLILLLLLSFFILRNLFKAFVGHRSGIIGNSLKSRLIATFFFFSVVPTALMFVIALFYINSSFDRWFSDKMQGTLKSALEVTSEYHSSAKKKNFNAAFILAGRLSSVNDSALYKPVIIDFRQEHSLDVVEYYPSLNNERVISIIDDETVPIIPPAPIELLKRVIRDKVEVSRVDELEQGRLIRVVVPLKEKAGVIAISSFIPISMISKMEDVYQAYAEMKNVNPLEYPLKSIYVIVLILMTLMILFCSVWFGMYIAKHLSRALETLGEATQKVAEGDYSRIETDLGETEVQKLATNFNVMVDALEKSRNDTSEANSSLKVTLQELDQRRRYMHVVLSNVNTGVISLDAEDKITMINDKAAGLLQINAFEYINRHAQDVLGEKYYRLYRQMTIKMRSHKLGSIEKEVVFDLDDKSVPSMLKISPLNNEKGEDLGKVVVFDDLTDLIQGQRAAAWKEVARRIAHEVKNPLTPIKLSAQRLQKRFSKDINDPDFNTCTNMIIEQTDSLKHLINEFSQFARLPETKSRLSSANELAEKVIFFYEQAHRNIRFIGKFDNQLESFYFDPEQLKRAIFNLVDNAVNATHDIQKPEIHVETYLDKSLNIAIFTISDNGLEISDKEMGRMFEPYYSKSPGGSGLGLTIVKKIVEDHNGFVRLKPNEGRGLIVRLELPYIKR